MANVIVTIKIMPTSPEVNLEELEKKVKEEIKNFGGETGKVEIEPVAFGLKSIKLIFVLDESKGGTELLEDGLNKLEGVNSVEVIDVRRAIG